MENNNSFNAETLKEEEDGIIDLRERPVPEINEVLEDLLAADIAARRGRTDQDAVTILSNAKTRTRDILPDRLIEDVKRINFRRMDEMDTKMKHPGTRVPIIIRHSSNPKGANRDREKENNGELNSKICRTLREGGFKPNVYEFNNLSLRRSTASSFKRFFKSIRNSVDEAMGSKEDIKNVIVPTAASFTVNYRDFQRLDSACRKIGTYFLNHLYI
jgi:hypothetical protein